MDQHHRNLVTWLRYHVLYIHLVDPLSALGWEYSRRIQIIGKVRFTAYEKISLSLQDEWRVCFQVFNILSCCGGRNSNSDNTCDKQKAA